MSQENHEPRRSNSARRRRINRRKKNLRLVIALVLLAAAAIGGTVAYLTSESAEVKNTFTPAEVACVVTEDFNGTTKSNVNVVNTGNIDAYIRVKLITYRVNGKGERIGGTAKIPDFAPGAGWVEHGVYYYYTLPVKPITDKPQNMPKDPLISSIKLENPYTDADGGKQVVEVMAEAIQSVPASAVGEAWGVTITENGVSPNEGGK